MRQQSAVVFDGGRGGIGGYANMRNCTFGTCVSCGQKRIVARSAWHRRCRPMCPCGGALEPSASAQKEYADLSCASAEKVERRCAYCNCKLRSGNMGVVCGCTTCTAALDALRDYVGHRDIAAVHATQWKYDSTTDWDFCGTIRLRVGTTVRRKIAHHTNAVSTT